MELLAKIFAGFIIFMFFAPFVGLLILWLKDGNQVFTDPDYFPQDDNYHLP